MPDKNIETKIRSCMAKIREIAQGIFDNAERKAVLDLVKDYEN